LLLCSRSDAVLPSQVKVSAVVAVRRRFVVVVRGAAMVVGNGDANGGRWWWLPWLRMEMRCSCATGEDGCCGGRRDVKVRADGGYCFWRVTVLAGEEMAAAAAMVGGREIRVRVSCVRWMR